MKLNPDCVRATLLAIENIPFGKRCKVFQLMEKSELSGFTEEEVQYTCLKLLESGYIEASTFRSIGMEGDRILTVSDLTYPGHEILKDIRSDTKWRKVKEIAKKTGVFSLQHLAEIAAQAAASGISSLW